MGQRLKIQVSVGMIWKILETYRSSSRCSDPKVPWGIKVKGHHCNPSQG